MIQAVSLFTSKAISIIHSISVVISKLTLRICSMDTDSFVAPHYYSDSKHQLRNQKPTWPLYWIPPKHLRMDTYSYPDDETSSSSPV